MFKKKIILIILAVIICAGLLWVISRMSHPESPASEPRLSQPLNQSQEPQNKPYTLDDPQKIQEIVRLLKIRNDRFIMQGELYLKEGKIDEAVAVFRQAMEGNSDPRPYAFLININLHLGNEEEAYRLLEKAGYYKTDMDMLVNEFDLQKVVNPPPEELPFVSVAPFKDDKQAAVSFTFDDGPKTVYIQGLPIFDEFGFKASIFVNPGFIRGKDTRMENGNWDDWRDAYRRGFEIGNHGLNHVILTDLNDKELDRQVNYSYELIEKEIGTPPASFVFPQDIYDQRTVEKALEKHLVVRQHGFVRNVYAKVMTPFYGGDYFSLESADKLVDWSIDRNLWLIPVCHAFLVKEYESYKPLTMDFLRKHLTYINDRREKIWVDTFLNVYEYLLLRSQSSVQWMDQKERSVKFILSSSAPRELSSLALTIVVNTSQQPVHQATAVGEKTGASLPVKIRDGKILVDAVPNSEPVLVRWE